jgi:hypothetical protein
VPPHGRQAEIGAIVLQPGLANICLVTNAMTITRQRIEVRQPSPPEPRSLETPGCILEESAAAESSLGILTESCSLHVRSIHAVALVLLHLLKVIDGVVVQMSIPKKRAGNSAHDKAVERFYRAIYEVSSTNPSWSAVMRSSDPIHPNKGSRIMSRAVGCGWQGPVCIVLMPPGPIA